MKIFSLIAEVIVQGVGLILGLIGTVIMFGATLVALVFVGGPIILVVGGILVILSMLL